MRDEVGLRKWGIQTQIPEAKETVPKHESEVVSSKESSYTGGRESIRKSRDEKGRVGWGGLKVR